MERFQSVEFLTDGDILNRFTGYRAYGSAAGRRRPAVRRAADVQTLVKAPPR